MAVDGATATVGSGPPAGVMVTMVVSVATGGALLELTGDCRNAYVGRGGICQGVIGVCAYSQSLRPIHLAMAREVSVLPLYIGHGASEAIADETAALLGALRCAVAIAGAAHSGALGGFGTGATHGGEIGG